MITETILNKFRNNILNENLHLNHGTKSAKVICHVDLDGVTSGISMVQQLIKQGIPKERITVEFAQYGDDEKVAKIGKKEASKFQPKNKSQWVGVTDYAKYPKGKLWDIFNRLMSFKGNKERFVNFANSRDFSKIANVGDFEKILRKQFNIVDGKFTKKTIDELYDALKAYSSWGIEDKGRITLENVTDYWCALVKPDFGSDHHSNDQGELSAAKRGEVAANSPSEAEFFASKYAPGLWSKDDLKAISMIDSAGYTEDELKNTIFLEKHFAGPDRKRNLATIISVLYDNLCKKDEKVAKWIILNSGPSLISLYSTVKQGLKFNGERLRMLEAVKNGEIKTGKEIAETLPKILKKNWSVPNSDTYKDRNGGGIKKALDREQWKEKNERDLKNAITGRNSEKDKENIENLKANLKAAKADAKARKVKQADDQGVINAQEALRVAKEVVDKKKGKVYQYNNFTLFDGSDRKTQYSRYMTSLVSQKGMRTPYSLRYWPDSMFQISLNTIYKQAFPSGTELLNLSIVNDKVLEDIRQYLIERHYTNKPELNADRLIKLMKEQNGGHKSAIWSFGKFDQIKAPNKELGPKYWDDKNMVDKASGIVARRKGESENVYGKAKIDNAKEIVPNVAKRFEEVDSTVNKKYKELAKDTFRYAIARAIWWVNKLYPPKPEGLEKLKNTDERFEVNA